MNKLQLTQKMLTETKSVKEIFEIEAVKNNWVSTFAKTSGRGEKEAETRFEAEKILFMQKVSENDAFSKCDKLSIYSAFIELSISGLSLRDGLTYIIPYKDKASFQVGWRGRLEQINELPNVIHCHEPQCVFDCDEFEYAKGMRTIIQKHIPGKRTKENIITYVYFVIDLVSGPEVYIMDALEVTNIRDNYSQSYQSYIKALSQPANKGKKIGDKLTISYTKNGQTKSFESNDLPMWVSDEIQAFKKTIVKRVWGTLPKLPKQKYLDEKLNERAKTFNIDPDRLEEKAETKGEFNAAEMDSHFEDLTDEQTEVLENGDVVNKDTGEIVNAEDDDEEETF